MGATTATTAGAATDVVQSSTGAGQILFDNSNGIALNGNGGLVTLTPGAGQLSGTLSTTSALIASNGFTANGLTLVLGLNFAPSPGTPITLVADSGSAISGRFTNLTQDGLTTLSYHGTTYDFQSSYQGGAGNDLILTAPAPPVVTLNPVSQSASVGGAASFTVAASNGSPIPTTVQWQVSTNGGASFSNLTDVAYYSGSNTTTLTISGATTGLTGNLYRAVFANAACLSATTTAASITVGSQYAYIAYVDAYGEYYYAYSAYVTAGGAYAYDAMNSAYSAFYYAYYAYYYNTIGNETASLDNAYYAYYYAYMAAVSATYVYSATGNTYAYDAWYYGNFASFYSYEVAIGN